MRPLAFDADNLRTAGRRFNGIQGRLRRIMAREFNAIDKLMTNHGINMRTAAYAQALNRISEAIESQGTSRYFSNGMVST